MSQHRPLPIFVRDCARLVRSAGSSIWLLQKHDHGFIIRAEHGTKQFSVIIPPIGVENAPPMPLEKGLNHVVSDLAELEKWLDENIKKGTPAPGAPTEKPYRSDAQKY